MRTSHTVIALLGFLLAAAGASAHHSYDVGKEVRLEGTLAQFVLRNPHSFVQIVVTDAKGTKQRWSVEWAGTAQLNTQGVQRESLRVGDDIIIVGRPSRVPGEYRALMVSLRRPSDGFTWGTREGEVVD